MSEAVGREQHGAAQSVRVPTFLRNHGLSIAVGSLFVGSMVGQIGTGLAEYRSEAMAHGRPPAALGDYLTSGHFLEALFENWESEFLQMGAFVLFTIFLREKGSSESKALDEPENVDEDPRLHRGDPQAPWPVRTGRFLWLYANSLSIALLMLFAASFALHAVGGAKHYNEEQGWHGEEALSVLDYAQTSRFWFESFQNWQSEFLSLFVLVMLSVALRQRGSPQSKPVAAANDETGE